MAQIRYRVENIKELEKINEVIDYKFQSNRTIRGLIDSLCLTEGDIQLLENILIVTGTTDIKGTSFCVRNTLFPIFEFEITQHDHLKIIFNCSDVQMPNNIKNIVFHIAIEK